MYETKEENGGRFGSLQTMGRSYMLESDLMADERLIVLHSSTGPHESFSRQ
jgi:hypothetical protein